MGLRVAAEDLELLRHVARRVTFANDGTVESVDFREPLHDTLPPPPSSGELPSFDPMSVFEPDGHPELLEEDETAEERVERETAMLDFWEKALG